MVLGLTSTQRTVVLICLGSLLAASAVAAYAGLRVGDLSLTCVGNPARGANLLHAIAIAFFGGIVAAIVVFVVADLRRWGKALVAAVLVAAAPLGVALFFVALDSATYVQLDRQCTDFGFGPLPNTTTHLGYLYAVWGGLVALLFFAAALLSAQHWRRPG
jgi:hypothetical protein